jgi:hypothetical protein
MPLPEPFSDIEHLQLVIRRYLNKQIREDFRDIFGDGDTWEPEVGTTRGSMLRALLHEDSDPIHVTTARMMLYYFTYGAAKAMQPDIYGSTIVNFDRQVRYKPQITLYFNNKGYNPNKKNELVEGEISFRLMNESSTTITQTELERYAAKIKTLFAGSTKFVWHKGKTIASYTEIDKGYRLKLLVTNESEAKRIIEQVLDIQSHIPDWQYLNININAEPAERFPNAPGNQTILGKVREKPKPRPVEDVIFRYATCNIHGLGRGINLVDTTFTRGNALKRAA